MLATRAALIMRTCVGLLLAASALATPQVLDAQEGRRQVGVFPIIDGTGGNNRAAGIAASQVLIDALATGTSLVGVTIGDATGAVAIDQEQAMALGKERGTRFVLVATILEASSKEANRSGWLPKIKGQTVHLTVHSIEAKAVLQAALYDAERGERLFTATTKGAHKDRAYAGRVWSSWGSWDVGDHSAFLASPMGKAFVEASQAMVKRVADVAAAQAPNH